MINDKFEPKKIGSTKKKKFKGHVKLTLKNAETGEVEQVVEGDNIVTHALDDIIDSSNYFGVLDYNVITPIYTKWFGGVLLYENEFPVDEFGDPDANDYFIKKDSYNHLIGHAGQNFNTDTRDDPSRGSPNTYLMKYSPDSVTMAWEFGPTQSNGQISSVCLTHADVGDAGCGKISNAFKALNPYVFAQRSTIGSNEEIINPNSGNVDSYTCVDGMLDDRTGFKFHRGDHNWGDPEAQGAQSLTFVFYEAALKDVGYDNTVEFHEIGYYSITNQAYTWFYDPAWSWDAKNKNLWLFSNQNAYSMQYDTTSHDWVQAFKIHFYKSNGSWRGSYSPLIIYPDYHDIGKLGHEREFIAHTLKKVDENTEQDIFYFPYYNTDSGSYDSRRLKRFNWQNQEDQNLIKINNDVYKPVISGSIAGKNDNDLVVAPGYVINDDTAYSCVYQFTPYDWRNTSPTMANPNEICTLAYFENSRWLLINKMVHTTVFNLSSSVMKTASQTMEVEYTITEVD